MSQTVSLTKGVSAMATARGIWDAAQESEEINARPGCYRLSPPVALQSKESGEIVHAQLADVSGKYIGTVHLLERTHWWPAKEFEIIKAMVWTCPIKECEGHKTGHLCSGFCRVCGTALEQVPLGFVAVNTPCPKCKASVFPSDKFCGSCGVALSAKKGE